MRELLKVLMSYKDVIPGDEYVIKSVLTEIVRVLEVTDEHDIDTKILSDEVFGDYLSKGAFLSNDKRITTMEERIRGRIREAQRYRKQN